MNLKLIKVVSRLTVLMVFFVVLFIMSAFLYSVRYWSDVYNYINANITIYRIPTLSEINPTVLDIEDSTEVTTEYYGVNDGISTTDIYDTSTIEYSFDSNFSTLFEEEFDYYLPVVETRRKREEEKVNQDYVLLPNRNVVVDYFFDYDEERGQVKVNAVIDEAKKIDGTGKEKNLNLKFKFIHGVDNKESNVKKPLVDASIQEKVFPWIVTIFLKNSTNNQFSYICDGALLSSRYILTAAQCVTSGNLTNISPLDLLVIAGKRSLQDFSSYEKALKVIKLSLHKNYTYSEGVATNDLAILQTEEPVEFNEFVQTCSALEDNVKEFHDTVTTAWNGDGSLVPVALKLINCPKKNVLQENVYCCTYENEVTGCPSYGGLHAVKINKDGGWFLKGIYNGDISKRAPFCFQQIFTYTFINEYSNWITDSIKT